METQDNDSGRINIFMGYKYNDIIDSYHNPTHINYSWLSLIRISEIRTSL